MLTVFPVLYIRSSWLIYFITRILFLLIVFTYFVQPPTPLPSGLYLWIYCCFVCLFVVFFFFKIPHKRNHLVFFSSGNVWFLRQRIRRMGRAKISMSHMHMVINEERLASHGGEQLWQLRLALTSTWCRATPVWTERTEVRRVSTVTYHYNYPILNACSAPLPFSHFLVVISWHSLNPG